MNSYELFIDMLTETPQFKLNCLNGQYLFILFD